MSSQEQRVENQIHFWSLIGPFFLLLSVAILAFKIPHGWLLSTAALIGIPLCVQWKTKGMILSFLSLFILSLFSYSGISVGDLYWHVGIVTAIACSLLILNLSLEEARELFETVELESKGRLSNLLDVDDKWREAEEEWAHQKKNFVEEVSNLNAEIHTLKEEKQTFFRLAQLTKEELLQLKNHYEATQQELVYRRQQISQLQETLEQAEEAVQRFVDSDPEIELRRLQELLNCSEQEKEYWRGQKERESAHLAEEHEKERQGYLLSLKEQAERYQRLLAENEALQGSCSCLEEELKKIKSSESDLKRKREEEHLHSLRIREDLQDALELNKQEKALLSQKEALLKELENEKNSLKNKLTMIENESLSLTQDLEAKASSEERLQNELLLSREKLKELEATTLLKESFEKEVHLLKEKNEALEKALAHAESSKEVSVISDDDSSSSLILKKGDSLPLHGNNRRVESMYAQLKEQFKEKSQTLDEARRQLFFLEQEFERERKEWEEERFEERALFEKEFIRTEERIETLKKEYREEVKELSSLIEALIAANQ